VELVTRLNVSGDRGRFDALAACFQADGVLRWATGVARGREQIAADLAAGATDRRLTFVRHHLTLFEIALAPDHASATGAIRFFTLSDVGPDHAGTYLDRYVREAEGWLIAEREVRVEWQSPASPFPVQIPPATR
jgi:hypothetical protein